MMSLKRKNDNTKRPKWTPTLESDKFVAFRKAR